jgi:hypothetical protein
MSSSMACLMLLAFSSKVFFFALRPRLFDFKSSVSSIYYSNIVIPSFLLPVAIRIIAFIILPLIL